MSFSSSDVPCRHPRRRQIARGVALALVLGAVAIDAPSWFASRAIVIASAPVDAHLCMRPVDVTYCPKGF